MPRAKKPSRPQFQESDFLGTDPARIPALTDSLNLLQEQLESARRALDKLPTASPTAATEVDAVTTEKARQGEDAPNPP